LKCRRYSKWLILYLYGDVTDDERRRFEKHLETCAPCRQELEAFQAIIDNAQEQAVPNPSEQVLNEIRSAAHNATTGSGQRVPGRLWEYQWYGVRARLAAAAACIVLVAGVVLLARVVGREPGQVVPEPPVIVSEAPAPSRIPEDQSTQPPLASEQSNTLMVEVPSATLLEDALAELEANTWYLHEQMALETAPVLDRRVRSLEHDVVRLASELE